MDLIRRWFGRQLDRVDEQCHGRQQNSHACQQRTYSLEGTYENDLRNSRSSIRFSCHSFPSRYIVYLRWFWISVGILYRFMALKTAKDRKHSKRKTKERRFKSFIQEVHCWNSVLYQEKLQTFGCRCTHFHDRFTLLNIRNHLKRRVQQFGICRCLRHDMVLWRCTRWKRKLRLQKVIFQLVEIIMEDCCQVPFKRNSFWLLCQFS